MPPHVTLKQWVKGLLSTGPTPSSFSTLWLLLEYVSMCNEFVSKCYTSELLHSSSLNFSSQWKILFEISNGYQGGEVEIRLALHLFNRPGVAGAVL